VALADGQLVMKRSGRPSEAKYWPTERFAPTAMHVGGAAGLVLAGFLISLAIGSLGGNADSRETPSGKKSESDISPAKALSTQRKTG
jgi:hypothetical protein